jgi:hypothetical protein
MTSRSKLVLKFLTAGLAALASAAAFAAYLRPDMLLEFANVVLCY